MIRLFTTLLLLGITALAQAQSWDSLPQNQDRFVQPRSTPYYQEPQAPVPQARVFAPPVIELKGPGEEQKYCGAAYQQLNELLTAENASLWQQQSQGMFTYQDMIHRQNYNVNVTRDRLEYLRRGSYDGNAAACRTILNEARVILGR